VILPNQFIGLARFVVMDGDGQVFHAGEARAITPVVYCKIRRELAWKSSDNRKVRSHIYVKTQTINCVVRHNYNVSDYAYIATK
jgi:hypothetical protein